MKTNYYQKYLSPELQIIEVVMEQGFSLSGGGLTPGVGGWGDGEEEEGSAE